MDGKTCRKFIFDGTCCSLTYTSSMFSHWNSNFLFFFSLLLLSIPSTFPFINFILPSLLVLFFIFATCALLPKMNLTRNLCNAKREGGERVCNFLRTLCFTILKMRDEELATDYFRKQSTFCVRTRSKKERWNWREVGSSEVVKPEVKSRSFFSFLESSSSSSLPAAVCCS